MRKTVVPVLAATALFLSSGAAWACTTCRPLVNAGVYDQNFSGTLLVLMTPLAILAFIGAGLYFFADRLFASPPTQASHAPTTRSTGSPESTHI
jgi:hypothetical protein